MLKLKELLQQVQKQKQVLGQKSSQLHWHLHQRQLLQVHQLQQQQKIWPLGSQ